MLKKQVEINPKTGKPKRAPRTMKEKKYVKALIENGGNKCQAVFDSYDVKPGDYNTATKIASENTQKLTFDDLFAKAGLTDEVIAKSITHKVLLAKKQNQFTGEVDDDHAIQLKATELALKIMGKFAPEKAPVDQEGNTVIPILNNVFSYNGDPQTIKTEEED